MAIAMGTAAVISPSLRLALPRLLRSHNFNIRSLSGSPDSDEGKVKSVPVSAAFDLIQFAGFKYLDVRTQEEFQKGHPSGATNIPYMVETDEGRSKNPEFVQEVSSSFSKDDQIAIGCLSGRRSLMAAADLVSSGFTRIVDVAGGYAAWRANGYPIQK